MKKSILLLLFFCVFIFLGIFVSVFLPKINIEITIKPQYQAVANAHEPESEKPHCVGLYDYFNIKDILKDINASYEKGYSLKGFSSSSYLQSSVISHFAVVCKEQFSQPIKNEED